MEPFDAFLRWLEIREENGLPLTSVHQLKLDADHSSLLKRLLEGGVVFPEPPPRSFSYPWCELIQTGRALPFEVHEGWDDPDILVIEQCDEWRILERLGEEQFIATYRVPDKEAIAKLRGSGLRDPLRDLDEVPMKLSASHWKVWMQGPMVNAPERKQWVIERLQ